MQTIHIELDLEASSDFVFNQLADHASYGQFPGIQSAKLIKPGTNDLNGVGAIRRINIGPFVLDEVIERYEHSHVLSVLSYRVIHSKPLPLKHRIGLITIKPLDENRCRVTWHSEFAIAVPLLNLIFSPIMKKRMSKGFAMTLKTIEKRYQHNTHFNLLIKRDDLHQHQLEWEEKADIGAGEVRLSIDRFALTANNITYAVLGESLSYWQFFPTKAGWGKLPVWGFADVAESNCEGINVGERFYGYFPFGSQLVLQPGKVNDYGFIDTAAHRQSLPVVYNHYVRTINDPAYTPDRENLQAIFRPLFSTAFLLDDFLGEQKAYGADTLVLSSASSKTAFSTAFLLQKNRDDRPAYQIIGLTSTQNVAFVKQLGCYDQVLSYDDYAELDNTKKSVFIDFASNTELRKKIHLHYGDKLLYSCIAGVSHWADSEQGKALPGPKPTLFFAPTQAKERLEQWGQKLFSERLGLATQAFFSFVENEIEISEKTGADEALEMFGELLAGRIKPNEGYVVGLRC